MEYRMYFFVPYNISDIQKGIQAGHCAIQYVIEHTPSKEFHDFFVNNKTWIILNGGTTRFSRNSDEEQGSLNQILYDLESHDVVYSFFCEPDLNNALSAICFLADERVWDKEKYPDYADEDCPFDSIKPKLYEKWVEFVGGDKNVFLRELLKDKHLA
jgi:hypothetical protein